MKTIPLKTVPPLDGCYVDDNGGGMYHKYTPDEIQEAYRIVEVTAKGFSDYSLRCYRNLLPLVVAIMAEQKTELVTALEEMVGHFDSLPFGLKLKVITPANRQMIEEARALLQRANNVLVEDSND